MIKILLVSIFSLIVANLLNGQNHRTLQFVDIVQNKPIYGVMVFTDGNFASVSDDNGNCQIDSNINEIYCKYLGYRDTLINVKDCNHCVISLETNYNLLGEVEVDAKYDEKKHLIKLLNESQETAYKLDTILYYRFKEINTISELGQTEMFTGILRVENKGYSRGGCIAFVSDISNYYNSTGQDTYELMQTKLMHVSSIITALNSDVLFAKQINRIKKKYDVERPTLFSKDSTSFLVLIKKSNVDIEFSYIDFINNKIKTRAFAGTNQINGEYCKYYFKMDYSLFPISIPENIIFSRKYILENDLVFTNYVELERIDNTNNESALNILFFNLSNKALIEKVRNNFPDFVIPSELIDY